MLYEVITRIMEIAEKYNLFVIEDTAQAIGCDFKSEKGWTKKAGTIGHVGCTSFFPSKNLGCYGDGGAIFTNDDEIAEKISSIVNHGMKVRYYHDNIGVNSRLDVITSYSIHYTKLYDLLRDSKRLIDYRIRPMQALLVH